MYSSVFCELSHVIEMSRHIATAVAAAIIIIVAIKKKKKSEIEKKQKRKWICEYVGRRQVMGVHAQLLNELRNEEAGLYKNFVRMRAVDFDFLLERITPIISRQDMLMRASISPSERLAVTLRFLATGNLNKIHQKLHTIYSFLKIVFIQL